MKTLLTIITTMTIMSMCKGQTDNVPVVRPATQANRFYTGDARELSEEVDSLLALHGDAAVYDDVAALIVPHAGYYFSGSVAAAAYMALPKDKEYERIFLLGPSHHEWLDGASVNTEADYYATPLGQVKVDHETAVALTEQDSVFTYQPKAHDREHCLEVQLPFLQRFFTLHSSLFTKEMPPIVPVIISTNDFQKLKRIAEVLKPYLTEDNLFVISSDFSHYPSYEDACRVDALTGKAIESGDVVKFIAALEENARSGVRNLATSACGGMAIATLLMMTDSTYQVKHLTYQNSGDAEEHDHNRVVGYHAFAITRRATQEFSLSAEEKQTLKEIALTSIKDSLKGKPIAEPSSLTPTLQQKCGVFVSLHKQGKLRGCIGHFGEDVPLHKIVAEMARAAAFEDPRFMPVTHDELSDIDIEISVLTPMRRIYSLDELELHRHGIYIRKGYRSGTFLPQVTDEVNWTKEEFVSHCAQDKAGIGWDGWKTAIKREQSDARINSTERERSRPEGKDAELYVYEAIVF